MNLVHPKVVNSLKKRKEWLKRRGKEFKIRKPRQIEPRGLERRAMKAYRRRIQRALELVESRLIPALPSLLAQDDFEKPAMATGKRDAFGADTSILINGIKVQFLRELTDSQLREVAQQLGIELTDHNLAQLNRTLKTVVDIDVFGGEPFLRAQVENFVEQNVNLIKSVEDRYFAEIQREVFEGARQGLSTQDISRKIRERGKVAKSRSDLIARDQMNKFNGQLSKLRQTGIGVEQYVWRTSLDERVRPAHQTREGKVFSWDDPPSDGHPGEAINCRCYAEPILEDLIEET
jgi:SPP1 gp7 family putative phage head morphogenesis protein